MNKMLNIILRSFGSVACAISLNACQQPVSSNISQPSAQNESEPASLFVPNAQASVKNENTVLQVNSSYLKQVSARGAGSKLTFNLASGEAITGVVESVQAISAENLVVRGQIGEEGHFAFVMKDKALVGHIELPDRNQAFEVAMNEQGQQELRSISNQDNCETGDSEAEGAGPEVSEEEAMMAVSGPVQISGGDTPIIDMLVTYTPAAKAAQGGKSAIEASIQLGIADTNRAFKESGIRAFVRLAGTMELSRNETGNFKTDLNRLTAPNDGFWDEVHKERARVKADQVTVIAKNFGSGSTAGIAWISATEDRAFSLVKSDSFGAFSFTHELGHNLGLKHTHGYHSNPGRFRTIIAYPPYVRILRFSNPSIQYKGLATGDRSHNEAGIINANAARMASFN